MRMLANVHRPVFARILVPVCLLCALATEAQTGAERTFPQSKPAIEDALKSLQPAMSGRLPALEGFAKPVEDSLDRYRRGYYQSEVEVRPNPSGGCTVRVSTKVTAWYSDPNGANSGYRLLTSNGRIEVDLLDQVQDQLAKNASTTATGAAVASSSANSASESRTAASPTTAPNPAVVGPFSPASRPSLPESATRETPSDAESDKKAKSLQAEADNLQQILTNMAHPKNLVAVRKSGTPIVSTPTLTAKPEFLASLHDEFELLDFNEDWVHVRISGLSRGWIWRNSVEMPEGISDTDARPANTLPSPANLYHVVRQESAPFPGNWPALRNKNVVILSVQRLDDGGKESGTGERLQYAKFLLEKSQKELAQKPQDLQGVVIIFDSADGGMLAVTSDALNQWVSGKMSDSAFWHKCFFDPPETLDSSESAGSK